jgi:serine/threonine protein kinase
MIHDTPWQEQVGRKHVDTSKGTLVTSNEEFEQAKRIFDLAADMPLEQRAAFLKTCACSPIVKEYVERMLAEFESEGALLGSPIPLGATGGGTIEDVEFAGSDRFSVRRRLGSGAFGTVYEAYDKDRKTTVALKLLERCKPDSLFRFKREFRSLVNTRHENLVHLYELISDGGRWFFTMELVNGVDFIEYVRAREGSFDLAKLKKTFRQLVVAVNALHKGDQLHRDLKPANVLVTTSGRVVVLDFGLLKQLGEAASDRAGSLVGTPAYMSPEQANHSSLTAASDWYSVGVMLFQALTGQLPHGSSLVQRWVDSGAKIIEPRILEPSVPEDLNDLCCRLLDRMPENRPNGDEMLRAVDGVLEGKTPEQFLAVPPTTGTFLGRLEEIKVLESAFDDTLGGRLNVVLIEGESGIGKTALVRHFLRSLQSKHSNLLALIGRCYEFELVPYKGLDALIDELSQRLQGLPDARVQALLPRDAYLLPRLFPVLGRVKAIDSAPVLGTKVPDAQELRQRTFVALRELFARLADRQPVVIWVDDLQWNDRDSSSFLAELCAPPLQPPLLLLLTYRQEHSDSESTVQYLGRMLAGSQRVLGNWRHVVLGGLTRQESLALVRNLLRRDSDDNVATKIVQEAQGHPLFLQELARFVTSTSDLSGCDAGKVELASFLLRRVEGISTTARELLELISTAVRPMPIAVLFAAATNPDAYDPLESLALLTRENLVRTSGNDCEKRAEPFHDQVRSVVVLSMDANTRKKRHNQLAKALASLPSSEPQELVMHYSEAGEFQAAFEAALIAAQAAEHQLAFDRAAMFYEAALDNPFEDRKKQSLFVKLADCLGKAGRGRDSANAYLKASTRSEHDSFEMRRLAADQLMRSGYIEDSMKLFRELGNEIGVPIPETPGRALRGIILGRLRARFQLFWGVPEPVPREAARKQVARVGTNAHRCGDLEHRRPRIGGLFSGQVRLGVSRNSRTGTIGDRTCTRS